MQEIALTSDPNTQTDWIRDALKAIRPDIAIKPQRLTFPVTWINDKSCTGLLKIVGTNHIIQSCNDVDFFMIIL